MTLPPPPPAQTTSCNKCGHYNISTTKFCGGCGIQVNKSLQSANFKALISNEIVIYICMAITFIALFYPNDDPSANFWVLFFTAIQTSVFDSTLSPILFLPIVIGFMNFKKIPMKFILIGIIILIAFIYRLQTTFYSEINPQTGVANAPTTLDWMCLIAMYVSSVLASLSAFFRIQFQQASSASKK